ncbi:death-inducer obliterator 1 isoform X2 [Chelonus insularis]|uniref:death-inducer obliterator 1 isoform X2 n=1 Tax=Chelonus insularis TaxID=460826 RepID=UPI00158DB303|nr:death-inducer obliterator 1 isoform X2 [Chelonus insularis]
MSNSYIVEPQETGSKKDDTLIIVVNDDGTIAVDQETLHNLIMNQSNANVSVVRVGQAEGDSANGDLTLTVDPPVFDTAISNPANVVSGATDTGLVDPFMEMDPEQLEKLETALQSEQAKQILGENVAAMLDMLTVEEQQNSMKYAIELDHCYTSRTSPSDPEPLDPLPVANSPEDEEIDIANSSTYQQITTPAVVEDTSSVSTQIKVPLKTKPTVGRPRKLVSNTQLPSSSPGTAISRSSSNSQDSKKSLLRPTEEEVEKEELSSSTESSDSETSDNDSDFGPRGPRRSGIRARGGRRGLTTRGGSMAASRRRGANKKVDIEQARRLDAEMSVAVDAMKNSDKVERIEKLSPNQSKKQLKIIPSRRKDESSLIRSISNDSQPLVEKPLQTTNQVKANLINANMIKGEMIVTKPGQSRNNQKVFFVQKKVVMKPNELINLGVQKQNSMPVMKDLSKVVNQIQTKLATTPDGKLISIASKPIVQTSIQATQQDPIVNSMTPTQSPVQKQAPKPSSISLVKGKPVTDGKKDKKKEGHDSSLKSEESSKIIPEVKSPEAKKIHKKDQKKFPGNFVDTLGPALFSTPDIIRRVGSVGESKASDSNPSSVAITSEMSPDTSKLLTESTASLGNDQINDASAILNAEEQKLESKLSNSDDIQPPLDPASNTEAREEIARPSEDSVRNIISDQSGIEGEEHLLATLEMEASKHEEELLAEALLLQEQLDVDLTDPTVLDGPTSAIPEPLLSASSFDAEILQNPDESSEISLIKSSEPPISKSSSDLSHHQLLDQGNKKDGKDVIQIIRGGRVITLPPIEAPATRSKRLQAKAEVSPKSEDRRENKFNKQIDDMDSDDEEEANSDSEDDPNRLWCICKRPHDNRFMICCDVCEDWFHGKCVNVSKAMGKQMEDQGIEWVCPNCLKKKSPDTPVSKVKSPGGKSSKITESPSSSHNVSDNSGSQSDKPVKAVSDVKQSSASNSIPTQCVVCKKEARSSSIYCSDTCILMHAQETLTKDKPVNQQIPSKTVKTSADVPTKPSSDARVIVFERRTGKVLTGVDAPTTSNLKTWLKEHPTFEVVRPNNLNTLQIGGKTITAIQTHGSGKITKIQQQSPTGQPKMVYAKVVGSKQTILAPSKKVTVISSLSNPNLIAKSGQVKQIFVTSQKSPTILKQTTIKTVPQQSNKSVVQIKQLPEQKIKKSEPKPSTSIAKSQPKPTVVKKSEPEPIRLNVRKTLAELLTTRIKETEDLKLSDEDITDLALKIELELYKYFRDTGSKYKAKYRSLVFNIKDTKNLTLFRKIADRSLTPDAVVRLSPEEMASQELAEWREKETKHQLEMIKKNELDLMAQAKSIVVKTHKGEQIIENDGGIGAVDPKTPVQDIVTALNNADNKNSEILDDKEETSSSIEDTKKIKRDERKDKDRKRDKDDHRSRNKEKSKDSKRDRSSSRRHHSRDRSRDRRKSKDGKRDKERERDRDREKDKDRERNKDKEKQKDKERDRSRRSSKSKSIHSTGKSSSHKEYKDKDKKKSDNEEEAKKEGDKKKEPSPVQSDKPIEDRLWRHVEEETTTNTIDGNDSDVSDREPSSTVNIKTPDINEEAEKEKEGNTEEDQILNKESSKNSLQTVWRGFVNMVDVAKFFITAQEVSGNAKDLMEDLPDTVDVIGRISHETVWDYLSKMKKTGSKEILVIRLTAANDEEKIPYITLYSYLNSRSRLGVVGSSKNIKDFYIMPFSSQSQIPPVLMPLSGPGFEDQRPHLLLGIIVRNKRKRLPHPPLLLNQIPPKIQRKESDRSYTPPLIKEKVNADKSIPRNIMDSVTISKIVPELSSKLDLTSSPDKTSADKNDDDEPYSPGELDDDVEDSISNLNNTNNLLATPKNTSDLQRKMEELNRQIEEQKQQIQSISSSILSEPVSTLPGLGLDPPGIGTSDSNEAYSPTDVRSFTPPPQGLAKFAQPILDKVSDITIPPNLQEILANVKRQETSKVDPYLPTKPGASFLTSANLSNYQKPDKTYMPTTVAKESKSTLRSLSDLDLIKKAEEELAAVAAASMSSTTVVPITEPLPSPAEVETPTFSSSSSMDSSEVNYSKSFIDPVQASRISDQPKPPGLEDEDFPIFPSTPPPFNSMPKTGVILNIKRKGDDDTSSLSTAKAPRTKSRWGQGPTD